MTPGRNCSTTTSALSMSGLSVATASGAFKSIAMLRLPRLSSAKFTLSVPKRGVCERISSPRPGRSILITSAPASARISVASGPGSSVLKSRTRMPSRGCIRRFLLFLNKTSADELPVDLVRAFPDLRDLRVAHQPLDPVILAITISAVKLHGVGRDAHREVRRTHLEHRSFDAEVFRARVDPARHVPEPCLAHREIGGHVREHELYTLELDDPLSR